MRKIVVSEFLTLDGVMEAPHEWSFDFASPEQNEYKVAELLASDALLLGRVTYEGFAAAWPGRTDEAGFADRFNSYPKYVVSTTLETADWNNSHIIGENVPAAIAALKKLPGRDILVNGSGVLVETLMAHDLVDEYRLMVFPVIVGNGQRLFPEGSAKRPLKLVDTATFSSGTVVLTYHPVRANHE